MSSPSTERSRWLFSRELDLAAFGGSALLALALCGAAAILGTLHRGTPEWAWIGAVLLVDVAHVYATGFRVYFDRAELHRRPWLYGLVPALSYAAAVGLYACGELTFWRVLAYLAVFHFVRQQAGWVALYRSRLGERDLATRAIDSAAVYAATLYPLLYWHVHLPRAFWWFLRGDFVRLPNVLTSIGRPIWISALALYGASMLLRARRGRSNPGKDLVVLSTAACWYVGIVALDSDFAFTVTNVLTHGLPYLALIYWYGRARVARGGAFSLFARGPWAFLGLLWFLAYFEELFWDRGVWHERAWLFGESWDLGNVRLFVVPLLALPQIVHYVLDGFVWRSRGNPDLRLSA